MFYCKNKKGFTFVELIVVITIIFIMTAVLMSLSFKDRAKKEVETVTREVAASIREAQNNSLTGKQKGNANLPCAFKFKLLSGDASSGYSAYQMFYSDRNIDGDCPADNDEGVGKVFFDRITLPEGVTIKATADPYSGQDAHEDHVIFLVPYGDFIVGDKDKYKGIDFVVEKDGKKYHICVHATGLIEEIGFNDTNFACSF